MNFIIVLLIALQAPIQQSVVVEKMEYYTLCYAEQMQMLHPENPYGWILSVEFKNLEGPQEWLEVPVEEEDWVGESDANVMYWTATITYDPTSLSTKPDWYLRQTAVHELWHVIMWELAELAEKYNEAWAYQLEEQLNTRIERWPFWLDMCPWPKETENE